MPISLPSPSLLAAAASVLLLASAARAETVFVDSFEDGEVRHADSLAHFWTVTHLDNNHESSASESGGVLRLRAATRPNTYIGLVSPTMETFGFFKQPVTVTLDEIQLAAVNLPGEAARFKISFTSVQERAEQAGDAISLRIRPGLLLLGYRIDGFNTSTSPENLAGDRTNSVLVQPLTAVPTRLSIKLGPAGQPGSIRYHILAEGNGVVVDRAGTFALSQSQWGNLDAASIVIDARRDSNEARDGSHTEFSVGRITVTR